MFSTFPSEPGVAGGKADFKFVFIGPLEVGQDALIPAETKRQAVRVSRLDAALNGEAPTGRDILVNMYKNGVSIGQVTIAAGATSGTLLLDSEVAFAAMDIATAAILQVGLGVRGGTLTLYGRIAT